MDTTWALRDILRENQTMWVLQGSQTTNLAFPKHTVYLVQMLGTSSLNLRHTKFH